MHNVFTPTHSDKTAPVPMGLTNHPRPKPNALKPKEDRECFYCRKSGHLIADCPILKRKRQNPAPKSVGFVKTIDAVKVGACDKPDPSYKPFIMEGLIYMISE